MVPWLENCLGVLQEVFLELDKLLALLSALLTDELGEILFEFLDS